MALKRKLYQKLIDWKDSDRRKPLIIRGARQVGKTTLVREFAKKYDSFIELNLEKADDRLLFEKHQVREIVDILLLQNNLPLGTSNVLVFIDEIQECPQAIQGLRFFHEDFQWLHVICAGSLLEHVIKHIPTFPVGRVQQMVLHPLDFEEFLWAKGNSRMSDLFKHVPVPEQFDDLFFDVFHEYAMIGGMPEVVKVFLSKGSVTYLPEVFDEIWQTYAEDIEKYGRNDTEKKVLRHIVATAAHAQDRITFAGFGNSNYRSREVGEAFQSLHKSRLIRLIYPVTSTAPPQTVDFRRKPRLQFLDTGLLNAILGIQAEMVGIKDLSDFYRGWIIQHLVYQEIQATFSGLDQDLHFWVREKTSSEAEVDLIMPHRNMLLPIEVKSGAQGRLRSLHQFMDATNHDIAVRLIRNHYSVQQVQTIKGKPFKLINLPYYLASKVTECVFSS